MKLSRRTLFTRTFGAAVAAMLAPPVTKAVVYDGGISIPIAGKIPARRIVGGPLYIHSWWEKEVPTARDWAHSMQII